MPPVRQPGGTVLVRASTSAAESSPLFLGFDFGTSGARAVVIDGDATILADVKRKYPPAAHAESASESSMGGTDPDSDVSAAEGWRAALFGLLRDIPEELRRRVAAVSLDGTSATTMVVSRTPAPSAPSRSPPTPPFQLGYDPESSTYPDWLLALPLAPMLPRVLPPGSLIGTVGPQLTAELALPPDCIVTTGTTDSIAAFLAARVTTPGYAVTSLGSTLAVKLVSTARIDDARFGVYSHRLPPGNWAPPGVDNEGEMEQEGVAEEDKECKWLVGGASNTGGAVLREHFTDEQLRELSVKIDPSVESKLDYYPLTRPGERFPVSDPDLQPRLTPRPADDALFLHGILESIATIEARAYSLLADLGASPPVKRVYTAGGGAGNPTWSAIRERVMGVPVAPSGNTDAAFGSALLAREGFLRHMAK
ncbi:unnamed protein product [Closterium sp. Yama58-4]|nr:unnamed protein product [Closterium sp. Yama58-4]